MLCRPRLCGAIKEEEEKMNIEEKQGNSVIPGISIQKYILLSFCTFGLYEIMWIYRQWKYLRYNRNLPVSPVKRALFSPLFFGSLVYHYAELNSQKSKRNLTLSIFYGLLYFLVNAYSVLSENYLLFFLFSFCIIPLILLSNNYYSTLKIKAIQKNIRTWQKILLGILFFINFLILISILYGHS